MVKYGIVTYHRIDRQNSLSFLASIGISRDDIFLQTQCLEDYNVLSKKCGEKCTVLYSPASNVCENKNNLLDYIQTHYPEADIVLFSDKTEAVQYLGADGKAHDFTGDRFLAFIERAFGYVKRARANIFGCYPVSNAFYCKHSITTNAFIIGCFMGFPAGERVRFDANFPLKEDIEITCRIINGGGLVIRFDDVLLRQKLHTRGGSYELWNSEGDSINERCTNDLLAKFGFLKRHPKRKNEVQFIPGFYSTIKKSILI